MGREELSVMKTTPATNSTTPSLDYKESYARQRGYKKTKLVEFFHLKMEVEYISILEKGEKKNIQTIS